VRSVVVSEDAESELELVYDYLSVFGEQTAEKFLSAYEKFLSAYEKFLSAYEKCIGMLEDGVVEFPLSRHPKLRAAGYRVALVSSYLVLYRLTAPEEVHVAHILHQSQEYARLVAEIH